ncbi:retrotransposon protein, putative, ty3-gypsy subclass [Tanacetum coccineum]
MDWLAMYHAVIVCAKKIIRIPRGNETLIVRGDGRDQGNETQLNIIWCTKTQKYMLKGCPISLAHVTTKETEDKSEKKRFEDVMPFGLKNVPVVFMDLINRVCKPHLDKFVIVFIDDILIYSKNKKEYEEHLKAILELLKKEELYAKFSKYEFWIPKEVKILSYTVMLDQRFGRCIDTRREGDCLCIMPRRTKCTVFTDPKSLQHILDQKEFNMRQRRWLELLSDYDYEIRYHPRNANVFADALNRKEQDQPLRAQIEAIKPENIKVEDVGGVLVENSKVLEKVGSVAYKFELPQELSRVHNTFYASNSKKCYADEPLTVLLDRLHIDDKLHFVEEPVEIMDREVAFGHYLDAFSVIYLLPTHSSDDRLRGLSVMTRELPLIDMGELVKLNICMKVGDDWAWAVPTPIHAPPPPPQAAGRIMPQRLRRLEEEIQELRQELGSLRGLVERSMTDQGRFSTWMTSCMTKLIEASGAHLSSIRWDLSRELPSGLRETHQTEDRRFWPDSGQPTVVSCHDLTIVTLSTSPSSPHLHLHVVISTVTPSPSSPRHTTLHQRTPPLRPSTSLNHHIIITPSCLHHRGCPTFAATPTTIDHHHKGCVGLAEAPTGCVWF